MKIYTKVLRKIAKFATCGFGHCDGTISTGHCY